MAVVQRTSSTSVVRRFLWLPLCSTRSRSPTSESRRKPWAEALSEDSITEVCQPSEILLHSMLRIFMVGCRQHWYSSSWANVFHIALWRQLRAATGPLDKSIMMHLRTGLPVVGSRSIGFLRAWFVEDLFPSPAWDLHVICDVSSMRDTRRAIF